MRVSTIYLLKFYGFRKAPAMRDYILGLRRTPSLAFGKTSFYWRQYSFTTRTFCCGKVMSVITVDKCDVERKYQLNVEIWVIVGTNSWRPILGLIGDYHVMYDFHKWYVL
jgi:hypothetical protein